MTTEFGRVFWTGAVHRPQGTDPEADRILEIPSPVGSAVR